MLGLGLLGLAGTLLCIGLVRRNQRTAPLWRLGRVAMLGAVVLMLLLWVACGEGVPHLQAPANYGTPPGTYTLTVTGTTGSLHIQRRFNWSCSEATGPVKTIELAGRLGVYFALPALPIGARWVRLSGT